MKIGIMGGCFDPIHLGHIDMAQKCKNEFNLDRIMFLPSGDPPHKKNITHKEIRIEMVSAAIKNIDGFFLSRMEADRKGKTYTYDTALALKESDDEYYFIIGGDSLNNLHNWFMAEELFKIMKFIVIDRQHVKENSLPAKKLGAQLYFSKYTGLDVSSTEVREKIKKGEKSLLLPECVWEIIKKYGLYKD